MGENSEHIGLKNLDIGRFFEFFHIYQRNNLNNTLNLFNFPW